jgi:hypothetical protein
MRLTEDTDMKSEAGDDAKIFFAADRATRWVRGQIAQTVAKSFDDTAPRVILNFPPGPQG